MVRIASLSPDIAATPASAAPATQDADFSRLFSEAMTRSLTESALSSSGGNAALPLDDSFGYLQSSLLAGASNGEPGGNEMLMYMLTLMMQEFKNSDLTPLFSALASVLPGGNGNSGTGANTIKPSVLGYAGSYNNASFLPDKAWLPTSSRYTSSAGQRSAAALNQVIGQFNVESAERYRPGKNGKTYCNIFVWDVTRALGSEIPHYVDKKDGTPRSYPHTEGAYELDANGTYDWLDRHGAQYGWREVSAEEAQNYANAGYPAVTAWKNSSGAAGHVQVVCPAKGGGYDAARGVTVAQAGSRNFSYAHLNATMSADKRAATRYFVHD